MRHLLHEIKHTVEVNLAREGIPARVETRVKRAYSVFQKLKRQKITLDQVYDLLAVRIITDSVKNCYAALGVIHNEWHPIPGRIKDFIAIPRPNLYQSLHTSVMGPGGRHFEVQIRTEEMHRIAEEGIAAHWKYKEGRRGPAAAEDDQRIAWLRQLVEWQREMRDPGEFMSTLKVDLYPEEVYTFTPRGKVIVLPRDATPIDFAYAIHSDVGNRCVGAKVNGRIVQLKSALRNGDVVEILTQPGHLPSKDWLAVVKTSKARNKIKHVINTTERAKAIEIGEKYLEREARRLGVKMAEVTKSQLEAVAARIRLLQDGGSARRAGLRQVFRAPGPAEAGARYRFRSSPRRSLPRPRRRVPVTPGGGQDLVIKVKGIDDLLVYRAKCCNPIRGEAIVGYVTRGKGVAVHSRQLRQRAEPDVRGGAQDRRRMGAQRLADVPREADGPHRGPARHAEPAHHRAVHRTDQHPQPGSAQRRAHAGAPIIDMTVEVRDKKQLERVVSAIRRISGVRDIERVNQ